VAQKLGGGSTFVSIPIKVGFQFLTFNFSFFIFFRLLGFWTVSWYIDLDIRVGQQRPTEAAVFVAKKSGGGSTFVSIPIFHLE